MVRDAQVRLLRQKMTEGRTQEAAAAAAGMSQRAARKWQKGPLPTECKKNRSWRTRVDPFAEVWESEVVPLLAADTEGKFEATTVLAELQRKHPGKYGSEYLRTLQRRVRDWRALHGPAKEAYFEQEHVPGREAALDFTHGTELRVTILGALLRHLIFEFALSFSGWTWVCLAFGETFEALVAGMQGALWELGGVPEVFRTDNLSAATHELKATGGRALNERFRKVLEHYGLASTRIRPGKGHENGVVEQSHHRIKRALEQALLLRGSRDFESVEQYQVFVREVVERSRNQGIEERFALERAALRPLPSSPVPSYTMFHPTVRKWSTIRVGGQIYSVPSRLIGHEVEARRHPDTVEVFYRGKLVETMPRIHGDKDHRIDYRHIIWSLVRKPGAFARYRFREELFPTLVFRRAYDALRSSRGERADVEYVRVLHLAASTMESTVEQALLTLLQAGAPFDYAAVRAIASPDRPAVPVLGIPEPDLGAYDQLLAGGMS
jgi:hypothetical protein